MVLCITFMWFLHLVHTICTMLKTFVNFYYVVFVSMYIIFALLLHHSCIAIIYCVVYVLCLHQGPSS
jgi:hypothetical protein